MLDDPSACAKSPPRLLIAGSMSARRCTATSSAPLTAFPACCVARPRYHKFSGYLAHTGRPQDLAGTGRKRCHCRPAVPSSSDTAVPASVKRWITIGGDRRRLPRSRRRQCNAMILPWPCCVALAADGPGWAMTPFLNRQMRARPKALILVGGIARHTHGDAGPACPAIAPR